MGVATTSTGFAVLFRTKTGVRPARRAVRANYPGTEKERDQDVERTWLVLAAPYEQTSAAHSQHGPEPQQQQYIV